MEGSKAGSTERNSRSSVPEPKRPDGDRLSGSNYNGKTALLYRAQLRAVDVNPGAQHQKKYIPAFFEVPCAHTPSAHLAWQLMIRFGYFLFLLFGWTVTWRRRRSARSDAQSLFEMQVSQARFGTR